MSLLAKGKTGRTLYCVAYENWRTKKAGHVYMHAWNYSDAVNQVLQSKMMGPMTRIVGIAPAIGAHYEEKQGGKIEMVYQ